MELVEKAQAMLACDAGLVESPEPFDRSSEIWRSAINGTTNEERIKSARLLLKDGQNPATHQMTDETMAVLVEMPTYAFRGEGAGNSSSMGY